MDFDRFNDSRFDPDPPDWGAAPERPRAPSQDRKRKYILADRPTSSRIGGVVVLLGVGLLIWALIQNDSGGAVRLTPQQIQMLLDKAHQDPLALTKAEIRLWGENAPDDLKSVIGAMVPEQQQAFLSKLV